MNEFDLELAPGLTVPHISYRFLSEALSKMALTANSFPVRSWGSVHNPDKTPVTGVCQNCRRAATEELVKHGVFTHNVPVFVSAWYAALGLILKEHKCRLDVCGCNSNHKE